MKWGFKWRSVIGIQPFPLNIFHKICSLSRHKIQPLVGDALSDISSAATRRRCSKRHIQCSLSTMSLALKEQDILSRHKGIVTFTTHCFGFIKWFRIQRVLSNHKPIKPHSATKLSFSNLSLRESHVQNEIELLNLNLI